MVCQRSVRKRRSMEIPNLMFCLVGSSFLPLSGKPSSTSNAGSGMRSSSWQNLALRALEMRVDVLQIARANAKAARVSAFCEFETSTCHEGSFSPREANPQGHILS